MKKFISLIFVLLITVSFCGCETKEERKARQAKETAAFLEENYEKQVQEYNDLKDDLDDYHKKQDRLNDW